jgi:hypothetical protein
MQLIYTLFSALALAASTTASPATAAKREALIAIEPLIILPRADTVWRTAARETVKWDVSSIPSEARDYTISILLGYFSRDGTEHLNIGKLLRAPTCHPCSQWRELTPHTLTLVITEHPLAQGIHVMDGKHTITVPPVPSKHSYFICRKSLMSSLPVQRPPQSLTNQPTVYGDTNDISPQFTILN